MPHRFFTLDVFTDRLYAGNPLAVVLDADDLADADMQTIAREFNLSETIFVQQPADPGNTAKVRIFFPTGEIPFAGHPTVGCAVLLAERMHEGGADFETEIRLEEVAGLVPVTVTRSSGSVSAMFTAPVIPRPAAGPEPDAGLAARALGIAAADIGFGGHGIGVVEGGFPFLYVPVASRSALASVRVCEPHWSELIGSAGVDSAYVYTAGGDAPETDYRARMFSPTAGVPEDPATGSATALLSAQLLKAGALADGANLFRLEQGYEMGRPSDLTLEVDIEGGVIAAVRIGGSAVTVSTGSIGLGAAG